MQPWPILAIFVYTMNYRIFLIIFLGVLFGFGPFLTDMYLPAFPKLQEDFGIPASMVQLSLSACMLGLAAGQAIWGPLSDRHGRRLTTKVSLWLFMASCIGCIFAPNIEVLTAMRLLQGIGGSGGIVLSRSVAADLYSGRDLARIMALIGAVNGIAPVTAPVAGGLLTDSIGWRGIFTVLLGIGMILIIATSFFRESLPPQRRTHEPLSSSLKAYIGLLKNRKYLSSILQYGFLHGIFFSYLASSPFIVQEHYGFSATGYSIIFAINATAVGVASMLSMRFRTPGRCTFVASTALMMLSIAVAGVLTGDGPFWMYESCTILQVFCCGLCFASTPAVAMDLERRNAGVAAALLGICTYIFGFVVTPLAGLGNTMLTTACIYLFSGAFTLYFAYKIK